MAASPTSRQSSVELAHLDGVMVGRAAYHDRALLLDVDPVFFGAEAPAVERATRRSKPSSPISRARLAEGVPLGAMTRHVLGLFNTLPGARAFRRHLATEAVKPGAGIEVLREAMRFVEPVRTEAAE